MPAGRIALAAVVGYLAGTLPSSDVASRLATGGSVDLRAAGSGNPGGANAAAVLGARWGYAVMAADIGKGAVAARTGRRLAGDVGQHLGAVGSVVGHCWPAWNGFRGGKGVGCSVGQCLTTFPAYFPVDLGVAALAAAGPWRQRAFVATATSCTAWVAAATVWWRRGWPNGWGGRPTVGLPLAAAVSSVVVLDRFRRGRAA